VEWIGSYLRYTGCDVNIAATAARDGLARDPFQTRT
jgi:hypothetical protein